MTIKVNEIYNKVKKKKTTNRKILFDASTRKDAVQFGSQITLAKQCEHQGVRQYCL